MSLSGATHVLFYDDVNAIELGSSDDAIDRRLVYQLGSSVFVLTADDRFERTDLPCGVRLRFHGEMPYSSGDAHSRLLQEGE